MFTVSIRQLRAFGISLVGLSCTTLMNAATEHASEFPLPLEAYSEATGSVMDIIQARAEIEPFNIVASLIFLLAIIHTFLTAKFRHWAHVVDEEHCARLKGRAPVRTDTNEDNVPDEVSFKGQILHFFG